MRKKNLKLSVILIGIGITGLQAQESMPASGSNASGSGGTANYTIGQVFYTTSTGTTGTVAQGVQQVFEIEVVEGIQQANDINVVCKAFPNPTSDFLILNVENYDNMNLSYQLFDMSGKLLENKKLIGNQVTITMVNRVSSIYLLKVIDNRQEIKTFKIIKN